MSQYQPTSDKDQRKKDLTDDKGDGKHSVELLIENNADGKDDCENCLVKTQNRFQSLSHALKYLVGSFDAITILYVFKKVVTTATKLIYNNEKQTVEKPVHGVVREYVPSSRQKILISFRLKDGQFFLNQDMNDLIKLLVFLLTDQNISEDFNLKKELDSCLKLSEEIRLCANDLLTKMRNNAILSEIASKLTLVEVSKLILDEESKLILEEGSKLLPKKAPKLTLGEASKLMLQEVPKLMSQEVSKLTIEKESREIPQEVPKLILEAKSKLMLKEVPYVMLLEASKLISQEVTTLMLEKEPKLTLEKMLILMLDKASKLMLEITSKLMLEEVSKLSLQEASKLRLKEKAKPILEKASKLILQDASKLKLKELSKLMSQKGSKLISEKESKLVSEEALKLTVKKVSKLMLQEASKFMLEKVSKLKFEEVSKPVLEKVSKQMLQKVSDLMLEKVSKLIIKQAPKLTLEEESKLTVEEVSKLLLQKVKSLMLEESSKQILEEASNLLIKEASNLMIKEASNLMIKEVSKLMLENVSKLMLSEKVLKLTLEDVSKPMLEKVSNLMLKEASKLVLEKVSKQILEEVSKLMDSNKIIEIVSEHPLLWTAERKMKCLKEYHDCVEYIRPEQSKGENPVKLRYDEDSIGLFGEKNELITIFRNGYNVGIFLENCKRKAFVGNGDHGEQQEFVENSMIIGLYPQPEYNLTKAKNNVNEKVEEFESGDEWMVGISHKKDEDKVFEIVSSIRSLGCERNPLILRIRNDGSMWYAYEPNDYKRFTPETKKKYLKKTTNLEVIIFFKSEDLNKEKSPTNSALKFQYGGYEKQEIKGRTIDFKSVQTKHDKKNFEDFQTITFFVKYIRNKIEHVADKEFALLGYLLGFGRNQTFELDCELFWNEIIKPFPGLILQLYYTKDELTKEAEIKMQENLNQQLKDYENSSN